MSGDSRGRGRGGRGRGDSLPFRPSPQGGGQGHRGGSEGSRGRGDHGSRGEFGGRGRGRGDFEGRGRGRGDFEGRGRGRGDFGRGGGAGRGRGAPVEVEVPRYPDEQVLPPDMQVENTENMTALQAKTTKPTIAMPQRPGYGVNGKGVMLWANYFTLTSQKHLELYRYQVTLAPDTRGKTPTGKKLKRIIQLLIEEHFPGSASDYRANIVSRQKLELKDEYKVVYMAEDENTPDDKAPQYTCRVQSTGSITLAALIDHLTSTQVGQVFGNKEETIQALNIVLGHHPKSQAVIATVGANRHFDKMARGQERMDLGAGLQVIRGYFMSVRAATSRLLVNVQVKNMAFYQEGPLDGIMATYLSANGPHKTALLKFVKKLSVDVTHIKRQNKRGQRIPRIKIVQGFATKDDGHKLPHPPKVPHFGAGAKDVQFWLEESGGSASAGPGKGKGKGKAPKAGPAPPSNGRYVSVFDFFKTNYSITVKNLSLPVINVATKDNPSYLPTEVCVVMPGQPAGTKLSGAQTQQMIRFAVRRPHQNFQSVISSGRNLLGLEKDNSTMDSFDLEVMPKMITVPGRVLAAPVVKYSGSSTVMPRFGSWDMRSVKFVTKSSLPSWSFLRIACGRNPFRNPDEFHDKISEFQAQLRVLGMDVKNFVPGQHITPGPGQVVGMIDDAIRKFATAANPPKLILVIVPEDNKTEVYNGVKFACDVTHGILNVCVLDTKFARANPQYHANVALKFNLKLGGRNHAVEPAKLGFISQKKTMIVGLDVTHPSPGSASNAPSVASIVASVDEWLQQWPAELRIQNARTEVVEDLKAMVRSRLLLWKSRNQNVLPENILVYRDGVSEGQYNIVVDEELKSLQEACKEVYPATAIKAGKPKITIIIVGKRHNTRFYVTRKEDADRGGNPSNGTVVDRGVTEARNWDFFLQAHSAIQGTARPAHYYVVYDEIFRDMKPTQQFATAADALEDLTHNMCYLFGRATKAVSICPPAYYADLVCTRARCYLSKLFDPGFVSDTSSVGTNSSGLKPDKSLVRIHPNVQNAMFYI